MTNNASVNRLEQFLLSPHYRIRRHLLLQTAILLITINIFWDTPDHLIFSTERLWGWLGYFLMINVTIYLMVYLLVPRFLITNKLTHYLGSVLLLALTVIILVIAFQLFLQEPQATAQSTPVFIILLNMFSGIVTVGLLMTGISSLLLFRYRIGYALRIGELEASTMQSELKFLKSQINPHFLFNMLNNANVLIHKNPPEAARVLFKLEDLLRYQLNESNHEQVSLTSEIHFLNDFLNLEKIRRDSFIFTITREGDTSEVMLPPLLFISFVENAVKHNNDAEKTSYVELYFHRQGKQLHFRCKNSKSQSPSSPVNSGGLGLKNIRRRLELLFPGTHLLQISENETSYTIDLHLTL